MTETVRRPQPTAAIPGPGRIGSMKFLSRFFDDPIAFYCDLQAGWGDVVRTKVGPVDMVMCYDLDALNKLLVEDHAAIRKGSGIRATVPVLGYGLFTSEGHEHARCRRQIQPAFQPRNLAPYDATMVACTDRHIRRWSDGDEIHAHQEMIALTLDIAAETMFGITLDRQGLLDFGSEVAKINHAYEWMAAPGGGFMLKLPIPRARRVKRAVRYIDDMVEGILTHRHRGERRELRDLLTLLLEATDEDGNHFDHTELRDHAVTMLLTAHDTISGALSWVLAALGTRPDIQERIAEEVARVCSGAAPRYDQVRELTYTKAAISEVMRLFPTSYGFVREPIVDTYELCGYEVHPGTDIGVPTAAIHRDPRWYDDPLTLRPERFLEENPLRRHRLAYMPFGAGPRACIGTSFAWLEMLLVTARIVQRWSIDAVDPETALEPQAVFTMYPRHGPMVRLTEHAPAQAVTG